MTSGEATTTVYVGNVEEVSTTASTTTTTTYYYAGGKRLALAVNGTFSYLGTDGLGSAEVALDANGNAQASVLYGPYGATRYSSGTMPGSYGFTGQRADATTGLDYYNARYYDPVAGQFTSADSALTRLYLRRVFHSTQRRDVILRGGEARARRGHVQVRRAQSLPGGVLRPARLRHLGSIAEGQFIVRLAALHARPHQHYLFGRVNRASRRLLRTGIVVHSRMRVLNATAAADDSRWEFSYLLPTPISSQSRTLVDRTLCWRCLRASVPPGQRRAQHPRDSPRRTRRTRS